MRSNLERMRSTDEGAPSSTDEGGPELNGQGAEVHFSDEADAIRYSADEVSLAEARTVSTTAPAASPLEGRPHAPAPSATPDVEAEVETCQPSVAGNDPSNVRSKDPSDV